MLTLQEYISAFRNFLPSHLQDGSASMSLSLAQSRNLGKGALRRHFKPVTSLSKPFQSLFCGNSCLKKSSSRLDTFSGSSLGAQCEAHSSFS